ncbi:unnamed protein product, partial [Owenia fusiformis]
LTKKRSEEALSFTYHGFVSYSSLDDVSIIEQIHFKMEREFGLNLAIHQRDFIPGDFVMDNIIHFVEASHKVIIILSNNYLASNWCKFEFELSKNKRLDATYDTMVMILLHDIDDLNKDQISPSLKSYLGQKTYLRWPKDSSQKPAFWLRLKEALDFEINDFHNINQNVRLERMCDLEHDSDPTAEQSNIEAFEIQNNDDTQHLL